MSLPIVVKYEMKYLVEEAKHRAHLYRSASIQEEFTPDKRKLLKVPLQDYLNQYRFVQSLVKDTDVIARLQTEEKRLAAFNQKFTGQFVNKNVWTAVLIEWKRLKEISTLERSEEDLLDAFFRRGLLLTNLPMGVKRTYLSKLSIIDDRNLPEVVCQLQQELDLQELVADTIATIVPKVVLAVAPLFPPTVVPATIGFAIQALVGLLEFFAFMADVEADGMISEEEAEEAWWQLVGILPFLLVDLVLIERAVLQIGIALFEMLITALNAFPIFWEDLSFALDEGWQNFGEIDGGSEIFIPSYAINDLERLVR